MKFYILKRLFHSIFVLVGISLVVFIMLHLTGDPAALLMPMDATPEQVAQFRKEMGFTDPVIVQYWRFFKGTLRGDFGHSFRHSQPALDLVLERMPATVQLTLALLFWLCSLPSPSGSFPPSKETRYWTISGLFQLQSQAYAGQGKRLAQHQSMAEAYVLQGNLTAAIDQLQSALKSGDGDFYQLSAAQARLRELRALDASRRKKGEGEPPRQ